MVRRLALLIALLWPLAAVSNTLDRAEALILQNDTAAALDILARYSPVNAAETERKLWAEAVALSRENRPRQAVPLLERLVSLDPSSARYRLELAAALTAINQDDRAKYHYGILRGSVPDPAIAAALDERLAALDRRKSWEGVFSLSLSPETNAARRTAADTVTIAGLPFVLNPAARAQPATGLRLVAGAAALPKVAPDTRLRFGVTVDGRFFADDKAPDDLTVVGEAGIIRFGDRARQLSATLTLAQRWIEGDPFSLTTGLTLAYSQLTGTSGAVRLSARLSNIDFDRPGVASAREFELRLRYSHNLSARFQVYGSGAVELRDSELAQDEGIDGALAIGAQYLFEGGLQIAVELEQGRLLRDGLDPLFATRRAEDRTLFSVRMLNRNWSAGGFTPVLEIGLERQTSPIAVYSYTNRRISIGVTRQF